MTDHKRKLSTNKRTTNHALDHIESSIL